MKTSDALEIEVTNFGPIVEANVDLRPFTLFVGPSNTGKSYLAMMIYALHGLFGATATNVSSRRRGMSNRYPPRLWHHQQKTRLVSSDDNVMKLLDWAQELFTNTEMKKTQGRPPVPLPEKIAELIRPLFNSDSGSGEVAQAEITRCFGLQLTEQLVRRPGNMGAQVVLRKYVGGQAKDNLPFVYNLEIPRRGTIRLSASIPKENPLCYMRGTIDRVTWGFRGSPLEQNERNRQHLAFMLIEDLMDAVFPYVVGPASLPAHYLPADRAGVMHAHRVVVGALVERATSAGIRPTSPMPMLSGVLADFLEQLIALGDLPLDRHRQSEDLASELEKTLLGGTVHHEERTKLEGPYSSFSYRPHGWKESLPMMRTSSMVSELAPVVLYLRHVVRKGDVLIIEEPESHLHPEMQVEFTRLLASVVRSGVRIIMTTHSEWVLEELANLVQASELSESERKAINGSDIALNPGDVGAWLFQPKKRPKGSVVKEIPLNRESGTFAAGYDKVAADVYNRWVEISSRADEDESK